MADGFLHIVAGEVLDMGRGLDHGLEICRRQSSRSAARGGDGMEGMTQEILERLEANTGCVLGVQTVDHYCFKKF